MCLDHGCRCQSQQGQANLTCASASSRLCGGRQTGRNETISVYLLEIHSLDDGDGVLSTSVKYALRAHIEVSLGYDIFYARSAGIFGQFQRSNRISFGIEIGFSGIAGLSET